MAQIAARRAVVLATGGYESNATLVTDLEGWTNWVSQFPPALAGDGLMLATEIGGAFRRSRNNMQLFLGFSIPPATPADEPRIQLAGIVELCSPHTMVVNRAREALRGRSVLSGHGAGAAPVRSGHAHLSEHAVLL